MKKKYTVNGLTIECTTAENKYTTCENIEQVIYLDREPVETTHTTIERTITVYENDEVLFQHTYRNKKDANTAFKMCVMQAMV